MCVCMYENVCIHVSNVILSCVCQVGLVEMSPTEASYRSLLGKLMEHDSDPLVQAYGAIEERLKDVLVYVKVCYFKPVY